MLALRTVHRLKINEMSTICTLLLRKRRSTLLAKTVIVNVVVATLGTFNHPEGSVFLWWRTRAMAIVTSFGGFELR